MKLFLTIFAAVVLGCGSVAVGVLSWQHRVERIKAEEYAIEVARQQKIAEQEAQKAREAFSAQLEMHARWRNGAGAALDMLKYSIGVWRDGKDGSWSDEAASNYAKALMLSEELHAHNGADNSSSVYYELSRAISDSRKVFAANKRLQLAEANAKAEKAKPTEVAAQSAPQ
jgi:hypothetical protein